MTDDRDEVLSKEEELFQIHKKQRKELQAKIQNLKKSSNKSDKKRKKEILEEIHKLESDLDQKQNAELSQLKLSQLNLTSHENTNEIIITNNNNGSTTDSEQISKIDNKNKPDQLQKVSKAKKRRDKKENAEKERNQRIIEQELLNINGQRNIENQTIKDILVKRDLIIHEIPSDGHCLYNAIAHQLKTLGNVPTLTYCDLRKKTAIYLRENSDDFLPFISNSDSDDLISLDQYEKYCDNVADSTTWGGDIELQVLSRILRRPIEVVQANGSPYIVGDQFEADKRLILTYHRHMYHLGAHYNSVVQNQKQSLVEN